MSLPSDMTSEVSVSKESGVSSSQSQESSLSSSLPVKHYDYGGYYDSLVSWKDGEDLRLQLHDLLRSTYTPIAYTASLTNWESNSKADQDLYDYAFVDAVYSAEPIAKDRTNVSWQREHAFCASLMTGSTTGDATKTLGRATDFHNLFASSANGNASRKNKNYGYADKSDPTYVNRTTGGGYDGYSYDEKTFEPGDKDKGRLARAIFYMATMYVEDEVDEKNNVTMKGLQVVEGNVDYVAGNNCAFAIGHRSDLLSWCDYPVDLEEYQHNESVYSLAPAIHSDPANNVAQGNRNPYVDYPELIDYAFGSKQDEPGALATLTSSYDSLEIGKEGIHHYAVAEAKRQYDVGDVFHKQDISVVGVGPDFALTPYRDFDIRGVEDGEKLNGGAETVTVLTPINDIRFDIMIATDPIVSATWSHLVTAKSSGNDFYGIATQCDTMHTLTLSGMEWNVYWKAGSVQSNNANLGAKFGTAATPIQNIYFESKDEFVFDAKNNVTALYVRGASSSGQTTNVSFYVGGEQVGSGKLGYEDTSTALDVGAKCATPKTGKVRFELSGITSAIYIKALAVHAE